MAKDRDGEALGANQSKKPATAFVDFGDQPQHPPQQQHHRVKSQKHLVGGATGGHRLHARIPSSKGLHKQHHASTSNAKLNRKHGSLSPDQGVEQALASRHHHRRATSELRLTTRDPSSSNLKSAAQAANLKRNRSQAEVHKRTKSATSLHRSASNPAVSKLRSSGSSGSRVQFNLGDDGQDDDDQDDDEWVDASTSASPLLSRRSSAVSAGQLGSHLVNDEDSPAPSPMRHREDERGPADGTQGSTQSGAVGGTTNDAQNGARSLPRNQILTSRILSRTPSHGAPPMMSAETASVRPPSSRQPSPPSSSLGQAPSLPNTPGNAPPTRPGSSGKAELTSRFVGVSSQEPGSGMPGESFILAANRGGLSRAALGGGEDGLGTTKRRQSLGAMSQARGIDALNARQAVLAENGNSNNASDGEGEDNENNAARMRRLHRRSGGDYVVPRETNRTQQKLNLQRASSSLEPAHPHPGVGIGLLPAGVVAAAGAGPVLPLLGVGVPTTYDSRDPRVAKMLERTGMEYLTVRRHLNPVARSVARVLQLPDLEGSRRIPARPGTGSTHHHHRHQRDHSHHYQHHASRLSEQFDPTAAAAPSSREQPSVTRNSSMVDLIVGRGGSGRRSAGPFASGALQYSASASSSLGTATTDGDGDDGVSRMRETAAAARLQQGAGGGGGGEQLSGSSLVNGAEDAETMALLRMLWEKSLNLGASQD